MHDLATIDRAQVRGKKVETGDVIRVKKIIKALKLNPSLSLWDFNRKYGTTPSNVFKI